MRSSVAGAVLRLGFALSAAITLFFTITTRPAYADCVLMGTAVVCSGASPAGFNAGVQDGLTVTVQPGATVGTGLALNDNNVVSNLGTISVGDSALAITAGSNNQITSSGAILGGMSATGISVGNGASVIHSGTMTLGDMGIGVMLSGTGSTLNSGSITAGDSGIGLYGPSATNTGTGAINVGDTGVGIIGTADFGSLINRGSIVAGPSGTGIQSSANSLNILNSGSILFGDCGIGIDALGSGHTILNSGSIRAGGCGGMGIDAGSSSVITNSGMIAVGDSGSGISGSDSSTVTNSGTITAGDFGAGISVGNGTAVTNSGSIAAGVGGIGTISGDNGTLTNSGTIVVGNTIGFGGGMIGFGDGARLANSGTITGGVGTPAMITTGDNGVLTNSGSITVGRLGGGMIGQGVNTAIMNSGTITVGRGGIGIDAQGDNATVANSGTINAGTFGLGIQAANSSTVSNWGSIAVGTGGAGVSGGIGTNVSNSGRITAGTDGVGMTSGGNMSNSGAIVVGDSLSFGAGGMVGFDDNQQLVNTGTIAGGAATPAMIALGDNGVLTNAGTITVGTFGGGMIGQGINTALLNSGTITVGTGGIGIDAQGAGATVANSGTINVGAGGTGIAAEGTGYALTNSGTISGCGIGIDASAGTAGAITNAGTITGTGCGAVGVNLGAGDGLINSGTISAPVSVSTSLGGVAVTNSGTLDGALQLGGSGVNALTNSGLVTVGAPLAPGGGVAHFIDGTFTQTASGTLALRLAASNAAGNYDTLQVAGSVPGTGVANLGGTLRPMLQPGLYGLSTTYAGALTFTSSTGSFTSVYSPLMFLNVSAVYHPTSVDLVVTRVPFNQFPGGGANARAVGNVLEANYSTSLTGPLGNFYTQLLQSTAPNTLSQLTGEVATAPQNASFAMFGQYLGTIFGQTASTRALGGAAATAGGSTRVALAAASGAAACTGDACDAMSTPQRYTAWAQGFGASSSIERNASIGNSRVDINSGGGATGIDAQLAPNTLVGFTMGMGSAGYSLTDLLSSGGEQSIIFSLYGGYTQGPAYLDGALGFAYNTFTTNRFIGTGTLSEVANASFDAYQYGGRVEGGWRFAFDTNVLTPFTGFTVQALTQSAYAETSRTVATGAAGVMGVTVQGQTATSVRSALGAQFETAITASDDSVVRPRLRLGWAHEFSTTRTATATLSTLLPNAPFTVTGAQPSPDALVFSAGFDVELGSRVRLYGQFDGEFSDNARSLSGTGGVRLVW